MSIPQNGAHSGAWSGVAHPLLHLHGATKQNGVRYLHHTWVMMHDARYFDFNIEYTKINLYIFIYTYIHMYV